MDSSIPLSQQLVLGEMLARWARKAPDAEALVFGNTHYSYRQFNERVNQLCHGMTRLGIQKGDKVGLISRNSMEVAESYFALAKIGAVAVPNNFRYTSGEFNYQLDHSDAIALIFNHEFQDVVSAIRSGLQDIRHFICIGGQWTPETIDYHELIRTGGPDEPGIFVSDNDPMFIMYTSGTTGRPKGAVLTHKNEVMVSINKMMFFDKPMGKQLLVFPLFHQGAVGLLVESIIQGAVTVILEEPSPENIMAAVQTEKIEYMALVPSLWNWIINHPRFTDYDLSSLQQVSTGAAPMPFELKKRIVELLPHVRLSESFGQTETTASGVIARHEDLMSRHGTAGKTRFNMETRVVDEDDRDLPPGQVGEIVYRGTTIMKEYYKDPKATLEAFRGGWFHSGDLVRQDKDGFIYVVDRKKDMIISGGENIYPAEIEGVLCAHPKILEAAVIGVPDPDWGEAVKAIVVLKQSEQMSKKDVVEHCKAHLAGFKKPKSVEFVSALPRNATGKVLKTQLRRSFS